jgi:2-polyprenyl-3-methyl-5-hydroxy-6-metoxy-1,4-benzoquinol methylase
MEKREISYAAREYSETKNSLRMRECIEQYTITVLANDARALRILDAGCGDGLYSRFFADLGASYVMGVDCTPEFVSLALEKSGAYANIDYRLGFIQEFLGKGDFDLVLGSYLLNYAQSREELIGYCRAIVSHLKPSGRFVGFNNNPFEVFDGTRYGAYGFTKTMHGDGEGQKVVYEVPSMTAPIINYYLSPQTHEQAFAEADLELEWKEVLLRPEEDRLYWKSFFENGPPLIAMIAKKKCL